MTQIIIANSFRGGTGKSTVVSNLGTYLASLGNKVIVIDGDTISPGIHAMFGFDDKSFDGTLTDFLTGKVKDIKEAVYDISSDLGLSDSTLFLVPSAILKEDIIGMLQEEKKRTPRLIKALNELVDYYEPDFILIDTHPGLNIDFVAILERTNFLFNIVRPDNQDYQGLEVTSQVARKIKIKNIVVMNRVHHKLNKSKLRKTIESLYKVPVSGMLPFSEDLMLAQSQFIFTERYPEHEFSAAVHDLAEKVFGIKPVRHIDVIYQILSGIREGGGITYNKAIMHKGVPPSRGKSYVNNLIENQFIRKENGSLLLTDKGDKFLGKHKTIKKFVDDFRL